MSFSLKWHSLIEPIFSKIVAIVPHIREILNIAFKPFNGLDQLENSDEISLRNRISFIDEKFKYMSSDKTNTIMLRSEDRTRILMRYKDQLNRLQNHMLTDMLVPLFEEMTESLESIGALEKNNFVIFYQKEMEHSLILHEKEFSINPIKKSLIRTLEEGLDYMMKMHPRRTGPGLYVIDRYHAHGRKGYGGKYSLENLNNSSCLDLFGVINFTWNSIGLRKDVFLTQFMKQRVDCVFELGFPSGRYSVISRYRGDPSLLEDIMDKLIIESSIMMRLWTTTSLFDKQLFDYMYPRRPIEAEAARIRKIEKDVTRLLSRDIPWW
nr:TPA_asm: 37 kDa protein [Agrostis ophiovirus_agro]